MQPLCECSDEALCAMAETGDRHAEELLVTRYTRLVRSCARPYFLAGGDSEDLIQEGMIGLVAAIRGYVPDRQSSFHTYAEACIRNRLRTAVRSASREKHAPLNQSVSLDPSLFENTTGTRTSEADRQSAENPEDFLIDREEREGQLAALKGRLSAFERAVLDLYLEGFSCGEISLRLERAPKAIDNAVQRIRRKAAPFFSAISV